MNTYRPVLAVVAVLLATGCTTPATPAPIAGTGPRALPAASPSEAAALPVPTGTDARERLMAALEKTKATTYRFAVSGDIPDAKKVAGSGAYDPAAQRISVKYQISGGGEKAAATQRIVVGTDLYSRQKDSETWVHLDLKRVKKDSLHYYDMTDPTGIERFVTSVDTVSSTSATAFSGTLDLKGDGVNKGFLPVGTPVISVLFGGEATFSATTDAAGWVTTIGVQMRGSGTSLTMTTKLSGHGKSSGVKKPPNFGEAWDVYYEK